MAHCVAQCLHYFLSALFEHASADATFLLALVTRAVVEVLNAVAKECEVALAVS